MGSRPWPALVFHQALPLLGTNYPTLAITFLHLTPTFIALMLQLATAAGPRGNNHNNQPDLSDTKPRRERTSLSDVTGISFSLFSFSLQVKMMSRQVYWLWRLATETSQALCSKLSKVKSRSILFIFRCGGVVSTRGLRVAARLHRQHVGPKRAILIREGQSTRLTSPLPPSTAARPPCRLFLPSRPLQTSSGDWWIRKVVPSTE